MAIDKKTGKTYVSTMRATNKWQKEHLRQFKLNFNVDTDTDVIARLEKETNRTEYIRKLVRAEIEKEKKNEQNGI